MARESINCCGGGRNHTRRPAFVDARQRTATHVFDSQALGRLHCVLYYCCTALRVTGLCEYSYCTCWRSVLGLAHWHLPSVRPVIHAADQRRPAGTPFPMSQTTIDGQTDRREGVVRLLGAFEGRFQPGVHLQYQARPPLLPPCVCCFSYSTRTEVLECRSACCAPGTCHRLGPRVRPCTPQYSRVSNNVGSYG